MKIDAFSAKGKRIIVNTLYILAETKELTEKVKKLEEENAGR